VSISTEYDVIRLDGMPFKAVNGVQVQNLSVFQRKFVLGDYTKDSHPLLSSWILSDLSGGHGISELQEGADSARFRWGVMEARRPRQITIPPLVELHDGPAVETCYPLGDLNDKAYFAFGTVIAYWDAATEAMVDTGDVLTGVAGRPTIWRGDMYIPCGSSGYDIYDGTTVTPNASPDAKDFLVFSESLLCVDTDGQLHQSTNGTTWNNLGVDAKLPVGVPRNLLMYFDKSGVPTPFLVTDRSIWAIDLSGPSMYLTELQFPPHRDQGLGSAVWRGDLFTSVGMGVFRYNGDTVSAIGLDRDHGLPTEIRGRIKDICNEYNSMWALVENANEQVGSLEEVWEWNSFDDEFSANLTSTRSSLHQFTGFGWHCAWESSGEYASPSWMVVTSVDDEYRLWWGAGTQAATMLLPIDFANARAMIESGDTKFAETGYFYSGHFDANMGNYLKIANAVRIRARYMDHGDKIRVTYYCGCQANPVETPLGEVTANGDTVLYFGDLDPTTGKNMGSPFHEIELRFYFERGTEPTSAPVMESCTLTFLKIMPGSLSWTTQLDMSAPFMGNNQEAMNAKLDDLLLSSRFFTLEHRDAAYRVRLAMISGSEFTGYGDNRGIRNINLLEIREDL
jgi:hypothetical protein